MDKKKRNLMISIAVVLVLLIVRMVTESASAQMDISENLFSIQLEEYETVLDFEQITSIELVQLPELGTCVKGKEEKSICYGVWKNDTWGQYTLYAYKAIENCIVVKTREQTVVLNYESADATKTFFEALTEYYQAKSWCENTAEKNNMQI